MVSHKRTRRTATKGNAMIMFIDAEIYTHVGIFWEAYEQDAAYNQQEINQQLFAQVMGWA